MSDDTPNNPQLTDNPTPDGAKKAEIPPVPYERFNKVNEERQQLADRLEKLEKAARQKEAEELEKNNEFKTLYEQSKQEAESLRAYKQKAEQYENEARQRNQDRIAALPEERRSLVPDIDDALKLDAWFSRNAGFLALPTIPNAPKMDGGAGGMGSTKGARLTPEQKDMARKMGMSEDDFAKYLGLIG